MTTPTQPAFLVVFGAWCGAFAEVLRAQWAFLDAQYRFGTGALKALLGGPAEGARPGAGPAGASSEAESLEDRARERTQQGLPPPRDVYEAQNRRRVDWSRFPEWARPSDPEMFEGGHEG
jgi:hypothetical protein